MTGTGALGKNLRLQLGLLEAKAGAAKTSIGWAKKAIKRPYVSRKLDSVVASSDSGAAIKSVQLQMIQTKLFHVRNKLLPKAMKKVKAFATQRVVKKIKSLKASSEPEKGNLARFEAELATVKALDHHKVSELVFAQDILHGSSFVEEKLALVAYKPAESGVVIDEEALKRLRSLKAFTDAVTGIRLDVENFLRKLFHEQLPGQKKAKQAATTGKKPQAKPEVRRNGAESFFMESLNADASDASDQESEDSEQRAANGVVFTDDDEDRGSGDDFSSDREDVQDLIVQRKPNRPGQLARRRMAEMKFGKEARHLKNGGLSVRDREAARMQKSQDRKERWAQMKTRKQHTREKEGRGVGEQGGKGSGSLHPTTQSNNVAKRPEVRIDPKLHPSWAAKLQQKNKVNQSTFQGQKIKFDEDAE
jgi:hypothetical protein